MEGLLTFAWISENERERPIVASISELDMCSRTTPSVSSGRRMAASVTA
jgi:hypothetical protein